MNRTHSMNQQKAAGKTVVITGASSGAGWAMATELAREGAQLVLASRRTEALAAIAVECEQLGAKVWTVQTDTREADSVMALAAAAVSYAGSIDVWINNAGVLAVGLLEEIPAEVNDSVIMTNLLGYVHGAQAVLPHFKTQGYGLLINNISIGAWLPTPYMAAYSASKFGLDGFTRALRGELRNHANIHVCNLYPGFLDTPGMQHAANYTGRELTPSPPLTDPLQVARAVVRLIRHPRTTTTVGIFPHVMRLAFRSLPSLTVNLTAALLRTYLKKAKETDLTSGNVLTPVEFGTGSHGGWMNSGLNPSVKKMITGFAVLLIVAGLTRKS